MFAKVLIELLYKEIFLKSKNHLDYSMTSFQLFGDLVIYGYSKWDAKAFIISFVGYSFALFI